MSEHTVFAIALFIFVFCVECIFVADYRSCMKQREFEKRTIEEPNQSRLSKAMPSNGEIKLLTELKVDRKYFVSLDQQTMHPKKQGDDIYGGFEPSLFLDKKGKRLSGAAIVARRRKLEKLQRLEQLLPLKDMIEKTV